MSILYMEVLRLQPPVDLIKAIGSKLQNQDLDVGVLVCTQNIYQ